MRLGLNYDVLAKVVSHKILIYIYNIYMPSLGNVLATRLGYCTGYLVNKKKDSILNRN